MDFMILCSKGNLQKAMKMYNLNKNIDISYENNYAFRWSCRNGHLNVANWLSKMVILTQYQIDMSFAWSCEMGEYDIMLWLYETYSVNINGLDNYGFSWSCINGHLNVVKWLITKHKFIVDDFTMKFTLMLDNDEMKSWIREYSES